MNSKLNKKEYLAYFSYGFGQCFSFGLVGSFMLKFYTDTLGISAVAGGIIFLIARAWDAFVDPMIAAYIDTRDISKNQKKKGKFRVYMKWASLGVAIATVVAFLAPDLPVSMKIAYAAVTYILWGSIYAFSDIPFWSVSTVMTRSGKTRSNLLVTANISVGTAQNVIAILFPIFLVQFTTSLHFSNQMAYFVIMLIIMTIAYGLMQFGYANIREKIAADEREPVSLKELLHGVRVNKYMFMMLIIFFLHLFWYLDQNLMIYFFQYNMQNEQLMSISGIIGLFCNISIFIIPFIIKRFKKRDFFIVILVIDIVARVLFLIVGYSNVALFFILWTVLLAFNAFALPLIIMMLAETVEYSEWKTGKRSEAIVFGGQTFSSKFAIAIAGALAGVVLSVIGYVAPDANGAAVTQSPETLNGLFLALIALPIVASVIRIIILAKYKLTEELWEKMVKEIDERKVKKALKKETSHIE